MLLVRGFIVGIAGRKHHSFDAQFHHLVEERAHAVRIGAVKQRSIGGDAEATLQRFANAFDCQFVSTFAANGKVVVFFLAVQMDGKCQDICWA